MRIGHDVSSRMCNALCIDLNIHIAGDTFKIAFVPLAWTFYFSWLTYPGMAHIHIGPVYAHFIARSKEPAP